MITKTMILISLLLLILHLGACTGNWDNLNAQVVQAFHAKNYAKAVDIAEQSLKLAKQEFGNRHSNTLTSMANLAELYQSQGRNDLAEPLYVETLALRKETRGLKHPDTLTSMGKLTELYRYQRRYNLAEPLYVETLDLRKEILGLNHPDTLVSMGNLALLYLSQGRYDLAEPLFVESLALSKETLGLNHPKTLTRMNNLAELYRSQSRYNQAAPLIAETFFLTKQTLGLKHPTTLISMNNFAELVRSFGFFEQAEPLFVESLALSKEVLGLKHPNTLTSMNNLAGLYQSQGRYELAESLNVETLAIRKEILGLKHPDTLQSMNNLADLYRSQERYDLAVPLNVEALVLWKEMLGLNHPNTLTSMNNLSIMYAASQQYTQAEKMASEMIRSTAGFLQQVLWGAGNKTRLAYLMKQKSNQNFYLTLFSQRNHPGNALEALNHSLLNKGLLLQIASQVKALSRGDHSPAIQKQIVALKNNRKQLSNLVLSGKGAATDILRFEETINRLEATLGQQIKPFQRANLKVTPEQVIQTLNDQGLLIDYLVYQQFDYASVEAKTAQLIALVVNPQQIPAVRLISLGELEPIAKLIEYYRSILKSEKQYAGLSNTGLKIGQQLYQALWNPLLPFLETNKTIYLIPDGVLNLMPFATLVDPQGQYLISTTRINILSSARELVLPSLDEKAGKSAVFAAPLYSPEQQQDYVIAENRNRGPSLRGLKFSPLPGALKEGQQLVQLMKDKNIAVDYFKLAQATEQQVNQVNSPRVLHLATHGYFLDDLPQQTAEKRGVALIPTFSVDNSSTISPSTPIHVRNPLLRSGLAFSNANLGVQGQKQDDGTDGILTAEEALALDLTGTELVVLSACETGIGKVQQGEGIYGLRRAFQEAGAKAVLSTLWSISDDGTQAFMQHFYCLFLNGTPAQDALQKTQLAFMKDKQWQHPFYWAPFVMTGM